MRIKGRDVWLTYPQIIVPPAALTGANTYMIARLVILAISAGIVSINYFRRQRAG